MKQMHYGESGFERKTKRTRKRKFLGEMNLVVPWGEQVTLIAARAIAPGAKVGRPAFCLRDHAAHPLHPAVIRPIKPGD